MEPQEITLSFDNETPDRANLLAESLAKDIESTVKDAGKPVKPDIKRTDPTAQDFGTVLTVILGTPAVIILANAVKDWVVRKGHSSIVINGNTITDVESKDVADIVKAMQATEKK